MKGDGFGFCHSDFFRHSSFGICASSTETGKPLFITPDSTGIANLHLVNITPWLCNSEIPISTTSNIPVFQFKPFAVHSSGSAHHFSINKQSKIEFSRTISAADQEADKIPLYLERRGGELSRGSIPSMKRIGQAVAKKTVNFLLSWQGTLGGALPESFPRGLPVSVGGCFEIGDHEIVGTMGVG